MQASDASFSNVIGSFRYVIPYFQRSYVWKQEQLSKFAEDMLYVSEEYDRYLKLSINPKFEYFMGTIISKPISSSTGYQELDLVDGQQRVTTFAIFFKVMSLVYSMPDIFDRVFKFPYGLMKQPTMILKLVSSQVDQPIMNIILNVSSNVGLDKNGKPIPTSKKWSKRGMHPLYVAYNYFRDFLENLQSQQRYVIPDNIINGVKFINMTLSGNDDPQVYFDNINSLGVRLTTSALIKNYIFAQNLNGYNDYITDWEPVFEGINNKYWNDGNRPNIDEFLFCYLQAKTYDQSLSVSSQDRTLFSRRDAVANHIKELCENYMGKNKNALLKDIITYSNIYSRIILDNIGGNTNLAACSTIDDMLGRLGYLIKKLKVSTMIPYLLFVVKKNPADTLDILKYLEAYLIRRSLTDNSNDNYNKFFKETLIGKNILSISSLKAELSNTNQRTTDMPTDALIMSQINSLDFNGDNETPKAILYMYELELNRANKAQTKPLAPDSYTLEHIMPQTLDKIFWPGPNQSRDHIYRIGNLGLLTQSLQSIIKNRGWSDKLNGYNGKPGIKSCCAGLFTMNNVVNQIVWDDNVIDQRTTDLVNGVIKIWKA